MTETKAEAVQTVPKGGKAPDTESALAASRNEEGKADQTTTPVVGNGVVHLRHVGRNPSYTLGNIRFERGEVKAVPHHYVEAALASRDFERITDEICE